MKKYVDKQVNTDTDRQQINDVAPSDREEPSVYDRELELSKLLKCNYTGRWNLYWCESGTEANM